MEKVTFIPTPADRAHSSQRCPSFFTPFSIAVKWTVAGFFWHRSHVICDYYTRLEFHSQIRELFLEILDDVLFPLHQLGNTRQGSLLLNLSPKPVFVL